MSFAVVVQSKRHILDPVKSEDERHKLKLKWERSCWITLLLFSSIKCFLWYSDRVEHPARKRSSINQIWCLMMWNVQIHVSSEVMNVTRQIHVDVFSFFCNRSESERSLRVICVVSIKLVQMPCNYHVHKTLCSFVLQATCEFSFSHRNFIPLRSETQTENSDVVCEAFLRQNEKKRKFH